MVNAGSVRAAGANAELQSRTRTRHRASVLALVLAVVGLTQPTVGGASTTGIVGHHCSDGFISIPDDSPFGASLTVAVLDTGPIADLNLSLEIEHPWVGDLVITLEHVETGTIVTLIDRPGIPGPGTFGCASNDYDILLDDEGTGGAIETLCSGGSDVPVPISPPGYTPTNPLSAFDGESQAGTWVLTVSDHAASQTGVFDEWCLTNLVTSFSPPGGGKPMGMAHDGSGALWMTDRADDEVHLMTPSGDSITSFSVAANSQGPAGIDTDGNTLYVGTLLGFATIDLYTLEGSYLSRFSVGPSEDAITYNPLTGNLYVLKNNVGADAVVEYTRQGMRLRTYPLATEYARDIAFDPKRCTYWLLGSDRAIHYDRSFNELETFPGAGVAGFASAEGVAVIGDRLFTTDHSQNLVVEYDISGADNGYCGETLATGDLDANGVAEAVADFGPGPGLGLWVLYNGASWVQLSAHSPEHVVRADADGNGQADLMVDFGPGPGKGLWIFLNNAAWFQVHSLSPDSMAAGRLDANAAEDVVVDFGIFGLWVWMNGASFAPLSSLSPEALLTADITGSGVDEVIADFGPMGLWSFQNLTTWVGLTGGDVETLAAGQMDGLAGEELVGDFGVGAGLGLWVLYNSSFWALINTASPQGVVVGDVDNNGFADVLADFGRDFALWAFLNNGPAGWQAVSPLSPQGMSVGQLDGIGGTDIMADFGPGLGLWGLYNAQTWGLLTLTSP